MALISIIKDPSVRQLRQFACIFTPIFCAILGSVFYFKYASERNAWVAGGIGTAFILVGLVAPAVIKPIFVGLMYLTFPIGWVLSHVLLLGVFYLVFTPIGLLMRLIGYDPMQQKLDRTSNTYWITRKPSLDFKRYFKTY